MPQRLRLVVLGANRVGKTALTVRYLTQRFIGEYSSRKDHVYKHVVGIDGIATQMEILDTCKYSTGDRVGELSAWGNGFLVVFSLTDPLSLLQAKSILRTLSSHRPRRPVILLANKVDLKHARSVSTKGGLEAAVTEGSLYLEVSAAGHGSGPELAFTSLARLIFSSRSNITSCTSLFSLIQRLVKRKGNKNSKRYPYRDSVSIIS